MSNRDREAGNEKDDRLEMIYQNRITDVDKDGNTVLHHAVKTDDEEVVERSIAAGCDVNRKNYKGDPPLACAIQKNCFKAVKVLLQAGASHLNSGYRESRGPLHIACKEGFSDIVQLLLDFGADVNARDKNLWTPLHTVNYWNRNKAREDDVCKIIKALIGAGAKINAKAQWNYTPLLFCIGRHSDRTFDLLLSLGANINVKGYFNCNILYDTIIENEPYQCKRLIELGADVNMINSSGDNLLVAALYSSNIEIMDFLLRKGVDVNAVDSQGYNPLCKTLEPWVDFAYSNNNTYEYCEPVIPELEDQIKMIDMLVKRGANLNHVTNNGHTSLYIVLQDFYHCRIAETLLRNGATFDFKHPTVRRTMRKSNKFFKLLLRHTAMFEVQNRSDGPANFDERKLNEKSKEYYDCCREELELIKSTKIVDTNVPFINILVNPNIGAYARNESIVSEFEKQDHLKTFPVYYNSMAERFTKELEIQKLARRAGQGLCRLLNWNENSMQLLISNIIFYLTEEDLNNLADV